jgi:hypothetical protein
MFEYSTDTTVGRYTYSSEEHFFLIKPLFVISHQLHLIFFISCLYEIIVTKIISAAVPFYTTFEYDKVLLNKTSPLLAPRLTKGWSCTSTSP